MKDVVDAATRAGLVRGLVAELRDEDDRVIVRLEDGTRAGCARLHASDAGLTLAEGDEVLVHLHDGSGVVVGRVGPSRAVPAGSVGEAVPDELVIEARSSLTLRVGDGSITLREDGRILIRGSDLVSHAKRMNRIRGGSVAIN